MKRKIKTNTCSCTVDALIENEATKWTEDDREFLSTFSQEQLDKIAPPVAEEEEEEVPAANSSKKKVAEKKEVVKKKMTANVSDEEEEEEVEEGPTNNKAPVVKVNSKGVVSIGGKTLDEYVKESLASAKDPAEFIDNFMPEELAGTMKAALKLHQDRRKKMIKGIVENSKFKEVQLKGQSDEWLESLYSTVVGEEGPADYSLSGGAFNRSSDEEEEGVENNTDVISAMLSFEQPRKVKEVETGSKKK